MNIFSNKVTLIADIFPTLKTAKDVVRQMSKKFPFRRPFEKWHGKKPQTLLKSEGQHIYHIYWLLWRQLSFKKFLLVIWKILGLFVDTLIADNKFSLPSSGNLTQPIQMQLSKKQKNYFSIFFSIFGIYIKFWTFSKKHDPHSLCISEITDFE